MAPCHCSDFSRAQLLHRGAATAGRGLPAIEAGMPVPAGTGLTRRSMLLSSVGLGLSVYGASKLGLRALEEGVAEAAAGPASPVIVSIFLPGGVDSLNVLAPVADSLYATYRPTLALDGASTTPFSGDTNLHWHPQAAPLESLYTAGKMAVLPAIGYTHPDQSHFTSRHFWEVGATDVNLRLGWLGRYLDTAGDAANPLQGLSLDSSLSPALATSSVPVATTPSPSSYQFYSPGVYDPISQPMLGAFGSLGSLPADSPALAQARIAAANSDRLRQQLAPFSSFSSPVAYPGGSFGDRLAAVAAMLGAGLPLRCVTLDAPGSYDTHSGEAGALGSGLQATVGSVLAFQQDLEARAVDGRVVTLLWSEFGRRPHENDSQGTDHGAAGAAFLIGSRVNGQVVGGFPGLSALDGDDNLQSTADFRGVYCALLEQWLSTDPAPIIPGASGFARPALIT